jgi:L-asparagine oxygenase
MIEEIKTSVVLEPGDLLVVDNNVAVHGRSPFTPRFDGYDRWLQRSFVVTDLAPSAGQRVGRVITTEFGH